MGGLLTYITLPTKQYIMTNAELVLFKIDAHLIAEKYYQLFSNTVNPKTLVATEQFSLDTQMDYTNDMAALTNATLHQHIGESNDIIQLNDIINHITHKLDFRILDDVADI